MTQQNSEEFESACENKNVEIINDMICSGFEPTSEQIYKIIEDLVFYDKIEAVKILAPKIDLSENSDGPFDPYSNHPFHKVRSVEMGKILVENGSCKFFDQWGMEPVPWPYNRNRELFKYLMENFKKENMITTYLDYTPTGMGFIHPLDEARSQHDYDMVEFLIRNGFDDTFHSK